MLHALIPSKKNEDVGEKSEVDPECEVLEDADEDLVVTSSLWIRGSWSVVLQYLAESICTNFRPCILSPGRAAEDPQTRGSISLAPMARPAHSEVVNNMAE